MSSQRRLALFAILVIFVFATVISVGGADYGEQWDRNNIKGFVNKYVRTGRFLPSWYRYPPMITYVAYAVTLPYSIPFYIRYGSNTVPLQNYLLGEVLSDLPESPDYPFHVNLRRTFAFLTMLSVLWVGIAGLQLNDKVGTGAALLLGLSWEISYHARIEAPDGVALSMLTLSLMCTLIAYKRDLDDGKSVWIWLTFAAIAAALAAATKYTAGFVLASVLAVAVLQPFQQRAWRSLIARIFLVGLVFCIAFIAVVPGLLLEQEILIGDLRTEQAHYRRGHNRQTVEAGLDHTIHMLAYFSGAGFSKVIPLAILLFLLAIFGIWSLVVDLEQRAILLPLLLVPVLYVVYMAQWRVLFVRNIILVLPFLALLGGLGIEAALRVLHGRWRTIFVTGLVITFSINAAWLGYTLWTIRVRQPDSEVAIERVFVEQTLAAIRMRQERLIYMTPAAQQHLGMYGHTLPENTTNSFSPDVDLVLFMYRADRDDPGYGDWFINWPGAAPITFGPHEINLDWYAHWPADERFVLASVEKATVALENFPP